MARFGTGIKPLDAVAHVLTQDKQAERTDFAYQPDRTNRQSARDCGVKASGVLHLPDSRDKDHIQIWQEAPWEAPYETR